MLPTTTTIATRSKLSTNDPALAPALAIALSWARTVLGRPVDDPLADLNDTGNDAVAGYAADVLRIPAFQAALADPANEGIAGIPYDIGRRWETALLRGNKHTWALR